MSLDLDKYTIIEIDVLVNDLILLREIHPLKTN